MADSNDSLKVDPHCYKCGGKTIFYTRLPDPRTGSIHELYRCRACGLLTSRVPDEK